MLGRTMNGARFLNPGAVLVSTALVSSLWWGARACK
jgi:hypothetical protein